MCCNISLPVFFIRQHWCKVSIQLYHEDTNHVDDDDDDDDDDDINKKKNYKLKDNFENNRKNRVKVLFFCCLFLQM